MVLAFNHIGRLGQLGNQMFQYASLKGIAKHRGFDYIIPKHGVEVDALGNRLRTELFDPFDLDVTVGVLNVELLSEFIINVSSVSIVIPVAEPLIY